MSDCPVVLFVNTRATVLESAPAFEAAQRLGLQVVVLADRPVVAPCGLDVPIHTVDTYDPSALSAIARSIAKTSEVKGVVGWRERDVEATAVVAGELDLPGHPVEVVRAVQDKARCRDILKHETELTIGHRFLRETQSLDRAIRGFPLPAIVKPVGSSASRGIHRVETADELESAVWEVRRLAQPEVDPVFQRFTGGVLIEEYVGGSEHSVEAIIRDGELLVGLVTDKWVEPDHHVEYLQIQPSALGQSVQDEMVSGTQRIVKLLGLRTGALHVEYRMGPSGPRLIEVNPRSGGGYIASHLIPLSRGFDFIEATIAVACDMGPSRPSRCANSFAASRQLLATTAGEFAGLHGIDAVFAQTNVRHCAVECPMGSMVSLPPASYTKHILASMISVGYSSSAVLNDLQLAATLVSPDLAVEQ